MEQQTLLIVESDVLVRHPLAEYLRDCGFNVVEASGKSEAQALLTHTFDFDVVLVSAAEGDPDFELVRWIRDNRSGLEVLVSGSVNGAAKKAGDLCEEQPRAGKVKHDYKDIEARIKRLLAARERSGTGERSSN